jgi:HSP20 family molecular chaperone IbpA
MVAVTGSEMSRVTFASHPYLLGFDALDRLVERTVKTGADGYPPYNIEQTGASAYVITLAVAGFREEDLNVTLENRQLLIRGQQPDEAEERVFLHRGIAARQFQRAFVLAEGIEVRGARLENGLLRVTVERDEPATIVQTIPIEGKKGKGHG